MTHRKRNSSSLCPKRTRQETSSQCDDCCHIKMIADMKREILELKRRLDVERVQRTEALREPTTALDSGHVRWGGKGAPGPEDGATVENTASAIVAIDRSSDAHKHALYELELCKKEMESTREALRDACEEREALRMKLSESWTSNNIDTAEEATGGTCKTEDSPHPHLDWVGRHYLAVSLPEDRMFKPGQSVTPVGVLQKLFEMRVGDKLAVGFSVLLENINIMLCQLEPEWYAKHFEFSRAHVHGNGYKSTDRVTTEDFAWLLFEYGAHAPLIEVLAGLLNVLNSTGKGGVTTMALCTSKNMYSSSVTLFRDTVSRAYNGFVCVRERAQRVRAAQGVVYMPLTAGLDVVNQIESQQASRSIRNIVLRSVLEGIEAPPHIISSSSTHTSTEMDNKDCRGDPLQLEQSLSAFMKSRGLEGQGKERRISTSVHRSNQDFPFRPAASTSALPEPLEKRVLFNSPWSNNRPAAL